MCLQCCVILGVSRGCPGRPVSMPNILAAQLPIDFAGRGSRDSKLSYWDFWTYLTVVGSQLQLKVTKARGFSL